LSNDDGKIKENSSIIVDNISPFVEINTAISSNDKSQYLVVVDKSDSSVETNKNNIQKVHSKYVSGYSMVGNPMYGSAINQYSSALNSYNQVLSRYQSCEQERALKAAAKRQKQIDSIARNINELGDALQYGQAYYGSSAGYNYYDSDYDSGCSSSRVAQSQQVLNLARIHKDETPSKVRRTEYQEYGFTYVPIEIIKRFNLKFYLINRSTNEFSKVVLPYSESSVFQLAKGVHLEDVTYKPNSFQTQDDIIIFKQRTESVSLLDTIFKLPAKPLLESYLNISSLFKIIESGRTNPQVVKDKGDVGSTKTTIEYDNSKYIGDLIKIKELLDRGIIDKDDYETMKQKIIDKL